MDLFHLNKKSDCNLQSLFAYVIVISVQKGICMNKVCELPCKSARSFLCSASYKSNGLTGKSARARQRHDGACVAVAYVIMNLSGVLETHAAGTGNSHTLFMQMPYLNTKHLIISL